MHVIVTGAAGYVGEALVQRLLDGTVLGQLTRLSLVDQGFGPQAEAWRRDARVALFPGQFAEAAVLDRLLREPADVVYHLASVPGGLAEREPRLGQRVNLHDTLRLFDAVAAGGSVTRLVFASSVAVYGALQPLTCVEEAAAPAPQSSYGAHKLMAEVHLADLSRRGQVDGLSLRLPGIVARPGTSAGHGSAFMSDLIRTLRAGQPYTCPVSAEGRCWWMSRQRCVDNLLHAATLPAGQMPRSRVVQLPVLLASVQAVAHEAARSADTLLRHQPDERIENLFARMPPLHTPEARALGFMDDMTLSQLVDNALA
ncbi:NAD-dependent epimerase/dehydratase family protein [Roseateles cellulosilyticus]|uniref:NAD-dependent epimerase/dehydratase family protein n=1 Tax=Pelomonas cellulosilytica TaxID=2906762 RepID=A0ABS8Y0W5_9BURK|nr:NAD-dependent epimerase/dehydratase family protein [Pelomonas sp. P8]MCE4556588.1 NAD-dependent epimerase/dehydratase family protein [Pelomonas sp. P8]